MISCEIALSIDDNVWVESRLNREGRWIRRMRSAPPRNGTGAETYATGGKRKRVEP